MQNQSINGRTQIAARLKELKEDPYISLTQCSNDNNLTHHFFANSKSIKLVRHFPSVLFLKCTCKTNKYKRPLLHAVGFTCLNSTFSSSFTFLPKDQEDQIWALYQIKSIYNGVSSPKVIIIDRELALVRAVQEVFPASKHLLCRWHIKKMCWKTVRANLVLQKNLMIL